MALSAAVITPALDAVAAAIESSEPVDEFTATVVVPSTMLMFVPTFTSAPGAIPSSFAPSDATSLPSTVPVTDILPGKLLLPLALLMTAVFRPAHPLAQLSGDEVTVRPDSALR